MVEVWQHYYLDIGREIRVVKIWGRILGNIETKGDIAIGYSALLCPPLCPQHLIETTDTSTDTPIMGGFRMRFPRRIPDTPFTGEGIDMIGESG
jgi:hypothetical protein